MVRWVVGCVLLALVAHAEYEYESTTPAGFSFSNVVKFSAGMEPYSAFPFINSAGHSKIIMNDDMGFVYVADDLDGQSTATISSVNQFVGAQDWAGLGANFYLTIADPDTTEGYGIQLVDAAGASNGVYKLLLTDTPSNVYCEASGIVMNPINKHLYVACANDSPWNLILDIDPQIFENAASGSTFSLNHDFYVLVAGNHPMDAPWAGLALSASYTTLYGVATLPLFSAVFGFEMHNGQVERTVYFSSPLPPAVGVAAGTGCLENFIYVSAMDGFYQLDFNGVQTLVFGDAESAPTAHGGYLHRDPLDGTLLLPAYELATGGTLLRVRAPTCGGFAGPPKYFSRALKVGSACTIDDECSTRQCGSTHTCVASMYLQPCQSNADCQGATPNGYWCQWNFVDRDRHDVPEPPPHHDDDPPAHADSKHGKHHKAPAPVPHDTHQPDSTPRGDPDFRPAPWGSFDEFLNPPRWGVCQMNECASNNGGCDALHADCIPTGDAQRICRCQERNGYYGNGLVCVNPCVTSNPCDTNTAVCSSTSPNNVVCTCNSMLFGVGTVASPCIMNPCYSILNDCASTAAAALEFCTPLTANTFQCTCGAGYWQPNPATSPQCLMNLCDTHFCDAHAICTPLPDADNDATCTCEAGYAPGSNPTDPTCYPVLCTPLNPPVYPGVAHATVGTCVGLRTGQTCQLGCRFPYHPRGNPWATCTGTPNAPTPESYYAFGFFQCVLGEPEADEHHDDDARGRIGGGFPGGTQPTIAPPTHAWACPAAQPGAPCRPAAPTLVQKVLGNTGVVLAWAPLGSLSPHGDVPLSLSLTYQALGGSPTTITGLALTSSGIDVTGLTPGTSYTFKLVVGLQGSIIASGLPLSVTL